jgi:hypothetical protein
MRADNATLAWTTSEARTTKITLFAMECLRWQHTAALRFNNLREKFVTLAEQWNFGADQRIRAALSIEKQWNLCGVRKWRIVVTLRARADGRSGLD